MLYLLLVQCSDKCTNNKYNILKVLDQTCDCFALCEPGEISVSRSHSVLHRHVSLQATCSCCRSPTSPRVATSWRPWWACSPPRACMPTSAPHCAPWRRSSLVAPAVPSLPTSSSLARSVHDTDNGWIKGFLLKFKLYTFLLIILM